jgi:hypothetical protein
VIYEQKKMAKIPKELYVTVKIPYEGEVVDYPLGFLHAHEPHLSTSAKKRDTQESWAYSGEIFEQSGKWYRKTFSWKSGQYETQEIETPYIPRVWTNEPLNGFKILTSVSRYSTSNKLWRILDPRGIQFEITTGCLENLILETDLVKGEIQGKCIWVSNKNLMLV